MIAPDIIRAQLERTLRGTDFAELGRCVAGKVRDNYLRSGRRVIVTTDRVSAFDVVLGTIPFKGQVLNELAAHWFAATRHLAPNHVLDVPDSCVTIAQECRPVPVEFVMRGYLTGVTTTSIWHAYERGAREFCGHRLPDGMRKNQPLPGPLLTPSTKAAQGAHDRSASREEIVGGGVLDAATFDRAAAMVEALFAFGQERARQQGLILVDTKYELGFAPDGTLMVIDEIHTPDSSRYWFASDYEERMRRGEDPRALDKEYLRRHLASRGYMGDGSPPPLEDEVRVEAARRYIEAYELCTGRSFAPNTEPPLPRIRRNLGLDA
jgi:phosphoribosylaminoimidazole-succinocarboxamide synthase